MGEALCERRFGGGHGCACSQYIIKNDDVSLWSNKMVAVVTTPKCPSDIFGAIVFVQVRLGSGVPGTVEQLVIYGYFDALTYERSDAGDLVVSALALARAT